MKSNATDAVKELNLSDLNIEGLGFDDVDFDGGNVKETETQKSNAAIASKSTPPKRQRKAVSLTFSDNSKPYGTALSYWVEHGLATPLIWTIIDELASEMVEENEFSEEKLIAFINSTSSKDIAKNILRKLKS